VEHSNLASSESSLSFATFKSTELLTHIFPGVAEYIEQEHSLLLQGPTKTERIADASCQTDFAGDSAPVQYTTLEGNEDEERPQTRALITETRGDRIGQWQGASARPDVGSGLPALDMLDLTSILESSQVISSVLQVDQLLKTMCEISDLSCYRR
jgi:hypothetical protein